MAAMRIIYGWDVPYAEILEDNNIEYLAQRRQRLTDKFIMKAASDPKYQAKWFPIKTFVGHDLRKEKYYQEHYARTDRLYNSPLYYYRRRLNEIHTPE